MSQAPTPNNTPARRAALTIMLIAFIGLAISMPLTLQGDIQAAALTCGVSLLAMLIVLFSGALIVAISRPRDDSPAE